MSKSISSWDSVAIWFVSIFLGGVSFALTQSIFNLFFVPIIVGVLWYNTDKVNRLGKTMSQIEAKLSAGPGATQERPNR